MSEAKTLTKSEEQEETIPFYPDHVSNEARVVAGILVVALIVGVIGLLLPVGLEDPADAFNTPQHVKPEWYFLALYQLLKYLPKVTGATLPVVLLLLIALLPFLDRNAVETILIRRRRAAFFAVLFLALIALTFWGAWS